MLMVGVGMAAPYLVMSAFPQLAMRMPRVGPWAELFKQMMGWLLIGSAVFFAAGRLISGSNFLWAVVVVATVAAIFLIARTIALGAGRRGIAVATSIAVLLFGSTFAYAGHMNGLFTASVKWTPYSDEALAEARAAGRPVLVKFTANWCGNCQYIEATVFHDRIAVDAIESGNVLALKADLTHDGAPGTKLLNELNPGGGIPFTAIYGPQADKPQTLSSIYTTGTLVDLIGR
jgi:thiol:disulfide interchange protein DsbD